MGLYLTNFGRRDLVDEGDKLEVTPLKSALQAESSLFDPKEFMNRLARSRLESGFESPDKRRRLQ